MNYWMLCLPREDIEHCIKLGIFGLSRKHVLGQVKSGDGVVCCAGKGDWKIIAVGKVTSDYYLDDKKIFLKPGFFPDRIDFQAEVLPKVAELDIVAILDQLSFVTNIAYWAVFFRNGVVKMSEADWQLVNEEIASSSSHA